MFTKLGTLFVESPIFSVGVFGPVRDQCCVARLGWSWVSVMGGKEGGEPV